MYTTLVQSLLTQAARPGKMVGLCNSREGFDLCYTARAGYVSKPYSSDVVFSLMSSRVFEKLSLNKLGGQTAVTFWIIQRDTAR